jgi:hypothetical protein
MRRPRSGRSPAFAQEANKIKVLGQLNEWAHAPSHVSNAGDPPRCSRLSTSRTEFGPRPRSSASHPWTLSTTSEEITARSAAAQFVGTTKTKLSSGSVNATNA